MPERITQILGDSLVRAIDAFIDAVTAVILAYHRSDLPATLEALRDARSALLTWLALLVERLDSRNAHMLVEAHQQITALGARVRTLEARTTLDSPSDDDHGHDETGRP